MTVPLLTRRSLIVGGTALLVRLTLGVPALAQDAATAAAPALPDSLRNASFLDAWIRLDADGTVTVSTGKVEFGQGIKTALIQIAAEQLSVVPARVHLVTADTQVTANEGFTAGSQSVEHSGAAIELVAAQTRAILVAAAARLLGVTADQLIVDDGTVRARDGRSVRYRDLIQPDLLHVPADATTPRADPRSYTVVGRSLPRVDIPAKLTGGAAYVHDLRLPMMLHARVVRPPSYGARLTGVDTAAVERLPGVAAVVRDGSFLAVVAGREEQAIAAHRALTRTARWQVGEALPDAATIYDTLRASPSQDSVIRDATTASATAPAAALTATYTRGYVMHGAIGPSAAVARCRDGKLTVWTHSQGVFPLRDAIAELVAMPPDDVRCIHMEGAGCYGHNGADDAAADAALIACAYPDRPIRVQWMREDEHTWEPYGSAMVATARGAVDANGTVADWQYDVWSSTHNMRPDGAANLMPAWHRAHPLQPKAPQPIPQPAGGGDRNAIPTYDFARTRVVSHFVPAMPLRVSALRSLGAYVNVFAAESFVDELAAAAHADPVEFRLRHLSDARARAVITTAAERFGWAAWRSSPGRGRGFAFARYKTTAAYVAIAVEVAVEHETGAVRLVRATAACDSGQAVNPAGIRDQIEGGILQSLSWTLYEFVGFTPQRITSTDWNSYPILRFDAVPEAVEVQVLNQPGAPFLGTGEAAQGPTAAAIANAIAVATGLRLRDLPFTAARVKAAIGV